MSIGYSHSPAAHIESVAAGDQRETADSPNFAPANAAANTAANTNAVSTNDTDSDSDADDDVTTTALSTPRRSSAAVMTSPSSFSPFSSAAMSRTSQLIGGVINSWISQSVRRRTLTDLAERTEMLARQNAIGALSKAEQRKLFLHKQRLALLEAEQDRLAQAEEEERRRYDDALLSHFDRAVSAPIDFHHITADALVHHNNVQPSRHRTIEEEVSECTCDDDTAACALHTFTVVVDGAASDGDVAESVLTLPPPPQMRFARSPSAPPPSTFSLEFDKRKRDDRFIIPDDTDFTTPAAAKRSRTEGQ